MSKINEKLEVQKQGPKFPVAESHDLLPRSKWLRQYYFKGVKREWNNEYTPFTTGTDWDIIFYEGDFFIVPEMHYFMGIKDMGPFAFSFRSKAFPVKLPDNFWEKSLPERRALFTEEIMLNYMPQEIISENDLLAGGRFNTQLSKCFNEKEAKVFWKQNLKNRNAVFKFHKNGFGNCGATEGILLLIMKPLLKKDLNTFMKISKKIMKN